MDRILEQLERFGTSYTVELYALKWRNENSGSERCQTHFLQIKYSKRWQVNFGFVQANYLHLQSELKMFGRFFEPKLRRLEQIVPESLKATIRALL